MTETGTGLWARLSSALSLLTILGAIAIGAIVVPGPAAAAPLRLTYRVIHSVYGDVGTYVNTIEPTSNGTIVHTEANFQVKMLGMRVFHEEAQRTERWRGNRLVSFHGVTAKNGDRPIVVNGVARGDSFIITSPHGRIRAPASVRPANPWSAKFLGSHTMMRPDTGKLEQVQVSSPHQTTVSVDGQKVAAREYVVTGKTTYRVWLDRRGVPVKFVVDDDTGKVTFTLSKCRDCELALSYLGGERQPDAPSQRGP